MNEKYFCMNIAQMRIIGEGNSIGRFSANRDVPDLGV
jgi:hypothetical protein